MAPFVVNRPVALLRCPGGTQGQCFFQKHAWKGQGKEILTFDDPEDDSDAPLLAIDGLPGLIALVQGGALEIHTWQSTLDDLEHPDQIVVDLDPGEGVEWPAVIAAAEEVRERLEDGGARGVREDLGRQGAARAGAARADGGGRVGGGQGLRRGAGALDGGGRAGPLRRDGQQGEAVGEDPDRLPAERAQQHGGRRLRRPGAGRGAGVDAARLGGARAGDRAGALHGGERAGAGRQHARSMGRFPAGGAAAAGVGRPHRCQRQPRGGATWVRIASITWAL